MTGVAGVDRVFARAREESRGVVIGYLPAGFPDKTTSIELISAMTSAGIDMVEVGIPYSDPVMDGPVICRAAEIALRHGATTADALDVVAATAGQGAQILVMSYWNLISAYGKDRFAADLASRGGSGVITPDLTPEEAVGWIEACDQAGLAHVFLAAPSSDDRRLAVVTEATTGFVYAAALMGVTGVRSAVDGSAGALVARLRGFTETPIAVGLGVSNGEQARTLAQFADGVIVGSAFVRRVLAADSTDEAIAGVSELAVELVAAVRRRNT